MKMKKYIVFFILIGLIFLLPFSVLGASIGKFTFTQGRVDLTRPGEAAQPATVGDEIAIGDFIRTKSNSKAEITFVDGSITRLAPRSRLKITEYFISDEGRKGTLDLVRGKVQSVIQKTEITGADSRFEVHTPTAVCGVRGTIFFTYYQDGVSGGATQDGVVYVYSKNRPGEVKTMAKGEAMIVTSPDQPPVVRPATDPEIQQHSDDTNPDEGAEEGDDEGDDGGSGDGGGGNGDGDGGGGKQPAGTTSDDKGGGSMDEELSTATLLTGTEDASGAGDGDRGAANPLPGPDTTGQNLVDNTPEPIIEPETPSNAFSVTGTYDYGTVSATITPPEDTQEYGTITIDGTVHNVLWMGSIAAASQEGSELDGYFAGVAGSWRGYLSTLYCETDDRAEGGHILGYLSADPSGSFEAGTGAFAGSGTVLMIPMADTTFIPSEFTALLNDEIYQAALPFSRIPFHAFSLGVIDFDGSFSGSVTSEGDYKGIDAGDILLGVWAAKTENGYYSNVNQHDLGTIYFGYTPDLDEDGYGYMIGGIDGNQSLGDDGDGHIDLYGYATYIDHEYLGVLDFRHLGVYEGNPGAYNSITSGTATLYPLAFSGYIGGTVRPVGAVEQQPSSLYRNDGGMALIYAHEEGIVGGRTSPWGAADSTLKDVQPGFFRALGKYFDTEETALVHATPSHFLWNTASYLSFLNRNEDGTLDREERSLSFVTGLWKDDGTIIGESIGFYEGKDETLGIIGGDLTGYYYADLGMWMIEGSLAPDDTLIGTYTDSTHLSMDEITGSLYADFSDGSYVEGAALGSTFRLTDNEGTPALFGIFDILFGGYSEFFSTGGNSFYCASENYADMAGREILFGSFAYNPYTYPESYPLNGLDMGGAYMMGSLIIDSWNDDGAIYGTLTNGEYFYLSLESFGSFEGSFYGLYDELEAGYGTWIGASAGAFVGEPLAYSGFWGNYLFDEFDAGSLFTVDSINEYGDLVTMGEEYGLFGLAPRGDDYLFVAMGSYDAWDEGIGPYLWNTPIMSTSFDPYEYAFFDNEGIAGYTTGIWNNGALEGYALTLLSRYDGETGLVDLGVVAGPLTGIYNADIAMWMAQGAATTNIRETGVDPSVFELYGDWGYFDESCLAGEFEGNGSIEGYSDWGSTYFAGYYDAEEDLDLSYPWGIYSVTMAGTYENPNSGSSWSAVIGGFGEFGYDDRYYSFNDEYGYLEGCWIASVSGLWNEDGTILGYLGIEEDEDSITVNAGTINIPAPDNSEGAFGLFITLQGIGSIGGPFYGLYDNSNGAWIGTGIGTFELEAAFDLSGYWEQWLLADDGGSLVEAGDGYGIIGLIENDGIYEYFGMGEFFAETGHDSYLWDTFTYGIPGTLSTSATPYHMFLGYAGGIWNNGTWNGYASFLYSEADQDTGLINLGYLSGAIDGASYPGIEMWLMAGTLTPELKVSGLDLSEGGYFWEYGSSLTAALSGSFGELQEGALSSEFNEEDMQGNTFFFVVETADQQGPLPWGIYSLSLGYDSAYSQPEGTDAFSAVIGGEGAFSASDTGSPEYGYWMASVFGTWNEDGTISGTLGEAAEYDNSFGFYLSATHMGTLGGPFYGLYSETEAGVGTWIAGSVGAFDGAPLALGGEITGNSLYYDGTSLVAGNSVEGLLGATTNPLFGEEPTDTIIMGTLDSNDPALSGLYEQDVTGWSADGDAFTGFMASIRTNEPIYGGVGFLFALYIDSEGNAGILEGEFEETGRLDNVVWLDYGFLSAIPQGTTSITPDMLYDSLITSTFEGCGGYSREEGNSLWTESVSGTLLGIMDQDWGIFRISLGGSYEGVLPYSAMAFWGASATLDELPGYVFGISQTMLQEEAIPLIAFSYGFALNDSYLYMLMGELLGTYQSDGAGGEIETGTWQASGLGRYERAPLAASGAWNAEETTDVFYNSEGYMESAGVMTGIVGIADEESGFFSSLVAMGSYEEYASAQLYLWNSPLEVEWKDGSGGFAGYGIGISGYGSGDYFEIGGISLGYMVTLFDQYDADSETFDLGIMSGELEGFIINDTGTWLIMGEFDDAPVMDTVSDSLSLSIHSGVIDGDYYGDFMGSGAIMGNGGTGITDFFVLSDGESSYSLPWGIYNFTLGLGNYYENPLYEIDFSAVVGGTGVFGYESDGTEEYYYSGYWMATVTGACDEEGTIMADLGMFEEDDGTYGAGFYITETHMGTIQGQFFGIFDEDGSEEGGGAWIGESLGTFTGEELAYGGAWGGYYDGGYDALSAGSLFSLGSVITDEHDDTYIEGTMGEEFGMFGLAPRGNDYAFLAIGEYEYYDESGSGAYIWNTPIASPGFDPYDFLFTYDGVAGYTSGIWKDGSMNGYAVALLSRYNDETGLVDLGFITGPLAGIYSPEIAMWMAEGLLTTEIREVGIDPEEYELYGDWGDLDYIALSGSFDGNAGMISGANGYGSTSFISVYNIETDYESSYPWGIYEFIIGTGNAYENPNASTVFSATIGGYGEFGCSTDADGMHTGYWLATLQGNWNSDGTIVGTLGKATEDDGAFGVYLTTGQLGVIGGPFYGLHTAAEEGTSGTWVGTSIGTYQGSALHHVLEIEPTDGYRNAVLITQVWDSEYEYLYYSEDGSLTALFGGSDTIWNATEASPARVLMMGEYYPESSEPHMWYYGARPCEPASSFTTDGGAYRTFIVGAEAGNAMDALLLGLYIDPQGNPGYLKGTMSGNVYSEIDMFLMDGSLYPTMVASSATYNPEDIDYTCDDGENLAIIRSMPLSPFAFEGSYGSEGTLENYEGCTGAQRPSSSWWFEDYESRTSEHWGIYFRSVAGTYQTPLEGASWTATTGGMGFFGSFENSDCGELTPARGYWLLFLDGEAQDNRLTGAVSEGYYITTNTMGIFSEEAGTGMTGDLLGAYDSTDTTWQAGILGTWSGIPTDFGGYWHDSRSYNNADYLDWATVNNCRQGNEGVFGLLETADGHYDFFAMGRYYEPASEAEGFAGPFLWSSALSYDDRQADTRGFEAFVGGIWTNEATSAATMEGKITALYFTEELIGENFVPAAGLMTGDLSGVLHEMVYWTHDDMSGMWQVESDEEGLAVIERFVPEDFTAENAYVDEDGISAHLAGGFGGAGGMSSEYEGGSTRFISYDVYESETLMATKSLPFGIYNLKPSDGYGNSYFTGKPSGTSVEWHATIGGTGYFGYSYTSDYGSHYHPGYWLADITGTWDSRAAGEGQGTISGTLEGAYMTYTHVGTIGGPFCGLYTESGEAGDGAWVGESMGVFDASSTLTFANELNADITSCATSHDGVMGTMAGILGGPDSLWTGSDIPVYSMGAVTSGTECIWYDHYFMSANYLTGESDTYDGGAFYGTVSGIKQDEVLSGSLFALYMDNAGAAGYLAGDLSGRAYETIGLYEMDGAVNRIVMNETLDGVSQTSFPGAVTRIEGIDFEGSGNFSAGGAIFELASEYDLGDGFSAFINGQDWGMWASTLYGAYTDNSELTSDTSDTWSLELVEAAQEAPTGMNHWMEVSGTKFSNGEMAGNTAGAWVNWDQAMTGVSGGTLKGTFDADNFAWEAVAKGASIETQKFLDMVANSPEKLAQLNIPCVQIGTTNLSGSNEDLTVNMIDVNFFAYSTGTAPAIWATDSVSGNYNQAITSYAGTSLTLSGNGFSSVDFGVKKWDNAQWGAAVNGAGNVPGTDFNVNITGAAAGTFSAGGTLSGTGAGVASPVGIR